jgi:hypothetical protein
MQKSWSKEALQLPQNPTRTLWLQDQAEAAAHGARLQGTSCPAFSMQPLEVEVPTAPTVLSDQAQGAARAAQSNGGLACMCSGPELDTKQAWPDFNSCSPQDTVIMASWGGLGHEWAAALSISACRRQSWQLGGTRIPKGKATPCSTCVDSLAVHRTLGCACRAGVAGRAWPEIRGPSPCVLHPCPFRRAGSQVRSS